MQAIDLDEATKALSSSVPGLLGAEVARMISISVFALTIYDWFLTLDMEIEHFWSGPWTLSRSLFLLNRYTVPVILLLTITTYSLQEPSVELCRSILQANFYLVMIALGVIQFMLVLRVWYLFDARMALRIFAMLAFVASFVLSMFYTHELAAYLNILPNASALKGVTMPGCRAARPSRYWRMFMPSLAFHTIVYLMTMISGLKNRSLFAKAPLLKRLLRDGGFFYFVVLASVTFNAVSSFLPQYPNLNIPAMFSPYLLAVTSIALSRIMLSIHSFSSNMTMTTNSPWMLSLSEMQRVPNWRKGSKNGEIVIEGGYVEDGEEDLELARFSTTGSESTAASHTWVMKATRVDDENAYSHW